MKVALMQPYFFPFIGYFQLISHVNKWVVFDDIQFINRGWVNRNRILHPDTRKKWQYITVALRKHSRKSHISNIYLNNDIRWREQILGKLTSYKKDSPFYPQTMELVSDCLNTKEDNLARFNTLILKKTCSYLDIPFNYVNFSNMSLNVSNIDHPGKWALEISRKLNACEYVNPPSGFRIYKEDEFIEQGIKLSFIRPNVRKYNQHRSEFVPDLSIIDVMMWNNKEQIRNMINEYNIVSYSKLLTNHESHTSHDPS